MDDSQGKMPGFLKAIIFAVCLVAVVFGVLEFTLGNPLDVENDAGKKGDIVTPQEFKPFDGTATIKVLSRFENSMEYVPPEKQKAKPEPEPDIITVRAGDKIANDITVTEVTPTTVYLKTDWEYYDNKGVGTEFSFSRDKDLTIYLAGLCDATSSVHFEYADPNDGPWPTKQIISYLEEPDGVGAGRGLEIVVEGTLQQGEDKHMMTVREFSGSSSIEKTYEVPVQAYEDAKQAIRNAHMTLWGWGDDEIALEGAHYTCSFMFDVSYGYENVSSDKMPEDGEAGFIALRDALLAYATDEYILEE